MAEIKLPIPYEEVDKALYSQARNLLRIGQNSQGIIWRSLTPIFGPLTTRERWDVLGGYGLNNTRNEAHLEGPALKVAINVFNVSTEYGYPEDILLLQLVQNEAENNSQRVIGLELIHFRNAVAQLLVNR